jgi:hypothetical protein
MKKESILRKAEHLGLQGFYKKNTTCAAITKNYFLFLCRKSVEIVFVKPVGLDLET